MIGETAAPSQRHDSDIPGASPPVAATPPLLRRAVRGRRLPENLQTAIRLDRRTVIGKEATAFRAGLLRHLGGDPSEPQKAMVNLAVQLRMRLLVMDVNFTDRGDQSAHDARQYLAWASSLRRALVAIGLDATAPTPKRPLTPRQIMGLDPKP